MSSRNLAIVQARFGSSRLPGKVLAEIAGESVLGRVLGRLRRSVRIDEIVVATSLASGDDAIEHHCKGLGVPCFRGSEDDVLDRFVRVTEQHEGERIVRINADNPFLAPEFLDQLLECKGLEEIDYVSYRVLERPAMLTPVGLFAEVVSRPCLERAASLLREKRYREHVTLGVYTNPERFAVRFLEAPSYASDNRLRLTLDTPADLDLLRDIAEQTDQTCGAESLCREITKNAAWTAEMQRLNAAQPK